MSKALYVHHGDAIGKIYTDSDIKLRTDHPGQSKMTNDFDVFLKNCDVVFECSGKTFRTFQLFEVIGKNKPIITLNVEFQSTFGHYFAKKGYLFSECEGDQPGLLVNLHRMAVDRGFSPVVYGIYKKFLDENAIISEKSQRLWRNPLWNMGIKFKNPLNLKKRENLKEYALKYGLSEEMCLSFTNGNKITLELIATSLFLDKTPQIELWDVNGMNRHTSYESAATSALLEIGVSGAPTATFVLDPKSPRGVFIGATHKDIDTLDYLGIYDKNLNLCKLEIPQHLCHLEMYPMLEKLENSPIVPQSQNYIPGAKVSEHFSANSQEDVNIQEDFKVFPVKNTSEANEYVPFTFLEKAKFRPLINLRKKEGHLDGKPITWKDVEFSKEEKRIVNEWKSFTQNPSVRGLLLGK